MSFDDDMARLRRAVDGLPEVVESTSYGTPSLKLGKKMLARLREPGVVVLPCGSEDDKHMLIEAAPDMYFTISHYDGYPLVLARMDAISDAELGHRLRLGWDFLATPKMRKAAGR
ncbi:MAG: MmcQ/YjbR family DNA-binding protein [Mesorhizobium sp.]